MDLNPTYLAVHTGITDAGWRPCPSVRAQFTVTLGAQGEGWLWREHPGGCMVDATHPPGRQQGRDQGSG